MQACMIPGSKLHYLFHHWCLGTKAAWQSLPSSTCSKPSSPAPPFISFKSLSFHVSMLVCLHLNLRSFFTSLQPSCAKLVGIPFAFFRVLITKPPCGKTQYVQATERVGKWGRSLRGPRGHTWPGICLHPSPQGQDSPLAVLQDLGMFARRLHGPSVRTIPKLSSAVSHL